MLRLFNTMSRKKENFKPIEKGKIRMYSCGLTVYDYAHIGNLRAYVFVDLLRRWLDYRGFDIRHVMNLTDVDDKTIRGMRKEGISLRKYTQRYIDAFFEDLEKLSVKKADVIPKATDHISEMVELIKTLMDKGYAYKSEEGSVYFSISKFRDYGKLSGMKIEQLNPGARVKVDEYDKLQACDFALWKAWHPDDGNVFWETELGKGRPGWSIECSAMSMKYLGETFDIHTGGVDNIFPHHENEIAQSEAVTGKKFVNYWLHNEHLLIEGERMGKSLQNFYTLRDLVKMGYDPEVVRYLLMSTHYRNQLNFTLEGLRAAGNALQRLRGFMKRLEEVNAKQGDEALELTESARKRFEEAMDDDLDINGALAAMFNLVREVNVLADARELSLAGARRVRNLMTDFNKVLAVLGGPMEPKPELSKEAKDLIKRREEARKSKDWQAADAIRSELLRMGIVLEDTPEGVKWKRKLPP